MTRTARVLTHYRELIPEIQANLDNGERTVYLVTDDGFAPDAQIWTEQNRITLLAQYARQAVSVTGSGTYDEEHNRLVEGFDKSREIYVVGASDLAEVAAYDAEDKYTARPLPSLEAL